jgi:hypothetical protein
VLCLILDEGTGKAVHSESEDVQPALATNGHFGTSIFVVTR